ncbi:ABC transporter [Pseudoclavibacter chungangensis]|uniref:ABC transporter n=1 Tax=Pseudoclavibacter chungangensis TaxID=587635 RepID=A0A7J5BQL2_9MICO|nr:GTPase [Pseudoclavibacter chungangensis]KAB1656297.1 ABC transporter [Pseudoclavibacter chungangensis]NYJ67057.1 GTP-binding protein EngB required for normal cell division [Pseudoclavibacter chungangensis]
MSRPGLDARLAALDRASALGAGRVDPTVEERLAAIAERAHERRGLAGDHTVVGFFGATGSGKSSLFNAVVGEELARAHVRRPTTSEPLAAVWRPEGSEQLLDWLEVRDRRTPHAALAGDPELSAILLDLPDFDSVEASHRAVAERLAGKVDVLVWVVDPQKYADAVVHAEFIEPLRTHGAVTAVVLNQIDLLGADDVPAVVHSLGELLRADGLTGVRVLPASARTGQGVDEVRDVIARFARARIARTKRLEADLDALAADLPPTSTARLPKSLGATLVRDLGRSAGVDDVATAVGRSYAKRAGQVTGWPLTSWLLRLRPDPLRRLHLTSGGPGRDGRDPDLHRTSLPRQSAAQQALAGRAVRSYADAAAEGLDEGWFAAIREHADEALRTLPDELDRAVARTSLGARGSWWWALVGIVQWTALLAALVGVGWYLAAWFLPLAGLPAPTIATVEGWPVPGLLVVGGVLLGILLGLAAQAIGAAVGAARRGRARRRLSAAVARVVDERVVQPIAAERARYDAYADALRVATAGR